MTTKGKAFEALTELLADEFTQVLQGWLSADELAELRQLTRDETNASVCHSGDYCDSNQAMIDAYEALGFRNDLGLRASWDVGDADDERAWDASVMDLIVDAAWTLAKVRGFRTAAEMAGVLHDNDELTVEADGERKQSLGDAWYEETDKC